MWHFIFIFNFFLTLLYSLYISILIEFSLMYNFISHNCDFFDHVLFKTHNYLYFYSELETSYHRFFLFSNNDFEFTSWNLSICIAFIQYLTHDGKGNGWRPPHVRQIDRDIITARLQLISMAQRREDLINVSLWKGQNCLLKLSPSQTPLIICAGYLLPLSAWWVPFISG